MKQETGGRDRRQDPLTGSCGRSNEVGSRRQVKEPRGRTKEACRDRSKGQDQEKGQAGKSQPKHEEKGSTSRL